MRELIRWGLSLAAALFLAALLASLGSGFGVDEDELNRSLSAESVQAIREHAETQRFSASQMFAFCRNALGGNFGTSATLGRPVSELVRERTPVTLPPVAGAWLATFVLALGAALGLTLAGGPGAAKVCSAATSLMLALPSALLALLFAWLRLPITAALIAAVLPQVLRYAQGVLETARTAEPVLAARARGIGGFRLMFAYLLWPAAPELIGLASLTLNLLIGAVIPIEALSGAAGIGTLVWQAALGRDVALIAAMTVLVSAATLSSSSLAEMGALWLRARRTA